MRRFILNLAVRGRLTAAPTSNRHCRRIAVEKAGCQFGSRVLRRYLLPDSWCGSYTRPGPWCRKAFTNDERPLSVKEIVEEDCVRAKGRHARSAEVVSFFAGQLTMRRLLLTFRTGLKTPLSVAHWTRFPALVGLFAGMWQSQMRGQAYPTIVGTTPYPSMSNTASSPRSMTLFIQTGDVARSGGSIESYGNLYNDFGLAQSAMWPAGTLCITIAANIADSGILRI